MGFPKHVCVDICARMHIHVRAETCLKWNLDIADKCLQWKAFTVARIQCNKHHKTVFTEQKLSNMETGHDDKTKQKTFFMFLFNFVLYCTFSVTVPFYCQLFVSTWRCCCKVQLDQKKGGRRILTEGCQSQGAEELMKWNCVQHQSRIYSLTKNVMPLQSRQQLSIQQSQAQTH